MEEMLICFFFVFDRWMTPPTPSSKPTDGFVAIGCTVPVFLPCSRTCCTALATRGLPPVYHGHLYREFEHGHCEVHIDILTHPSDPSMTAWFTTAMGDDLNDTLDRAAHHALMEFCEHHLSDLNGTVVALFPVRNEGNTTWSERLATVGAPERTTYHTGWAFTACYAQRVSSILQKVTVTAAYQRLCLEEYDHQVEAKTCLIKDIQKGNRELLQQNHRLEMCAKEMNNELMRMYHSCDVKTDLLDDACT
jgi:hypothetical protein